ncbi:polysaccharide deacetylase family protein [Desulfoluna butyratoxydans]|uniref:Glycoside hydrolase/deacetylase beta/alpha-barrel n=1 Tax=Desulfoluna butyratoxydans TaxID=231438 RepID=A0A4U8YT17_9BACT|nr:polysaccharide deacetylase family protein [Desulfoluna butyratoxydans]VFQ44443.1 glycoside hydrolase/deacetylase beta/alpha-barrel [Desulfoluna butyratoxydans]
MGPFDLTGAKGAVKRAMAWAYCRTGLMARRLADLSFGAYPVLMYHRVLSESEAAGTTQPGMYVTPETFEAHVAFLKERFDIVSLEKALLLALSANGAGSGRPYCVLTFDDGWIDFYENAYPILMGARATATVFLPTAFIGEDRIFWTDRLVALYYGRQKDAGPTGPSKDSRVRALEGLKGPVEAQIEAAAALLKKEPIAEIEKVLTRLSERWQVGFDPSKRAFINWQEVEEMRASGLITFGSHTHGHHLLTLLSDEEVAEELSVSMAQLCARGAVDPGFLPFCYPNGNWSPAVARQVESCGFAAAVTTEWGWNDGRGDVYSLSRIPVHEDMTNSDRMFGCRLAGLL